jgi:hypothetical protein
MKKRFMWVLELAPKALALGLVLLGLAGYAIYNANHGGSIPPESALASAGGHITQGREVTIEHRRGGARWVERYYELELRQGNDAILTLRLDFFVLPNPALEDVMDKDVGVKYDANNSNTIYAIQRDGKDLLSYAAMAKRSRTMANSIKSDSASAGMIGLGFLLALLGSGGIWWRLRLLKADRELAATVATDKSSAAPH